MRTALNASSLIAAVLLLLLAGPGSAFGADSGWTTQEGESIPGDLVRFDFESKEAIFQISEGASENPVPTADLSPDSRWRLLMSPIFSRSFPTEEWAPEQTYYLTLAIGVPIFFLLLSFWICAAILLKKLNPLRALAGWFGSAVLGGFLIGFYLVLSARSPGSATGILIFGALLSLFLLSMYVSAIYHVSTMEGFKVLICHVFGAFFFLALTMLTVSQLTKSFDLEPVVQERIMIPVGIIPEN